MKILVTGKTGQLSCEINKISSLYNFEWIFLDRNSFDLSDLNSINSNLDKISPNIIINCAALTSVNYAESNFDYANIVNNQSVSLIAKWCNLNNRKLLHISTDYVYSGSLEIPINEDVVADPLNNYGRTKLLGDLACLEFNPSSIIIRTSWLYSSFGNNFVKKMISLMIKKKELDVINDHIGSPT